MMKPFPVKVSLSDSCFILGALMILILPLKLLLSVILAAAIHECSHIFALFLFRMPIQSIHIHSSGVSILTPPMPPLPELLCALAGPMGSLLCLLLAHRFPLLALCALLQGIFNLLPVYPLDGGRVFRCATALVLPFHADSISKFTSLGVTAGLCGYFVVLFLRTLDGFFLLLCISFLLKICHPRKTPCKEDAHWVQ